MVTPVFAQELSFDDQFVSSEEYTKLMDRLNKLENQRSGDLIQTVQTIAGIATAGAFVFLGYQTLMLRSEKNHTLRAWVGELNTDVEIFSYINAKNEEKTHEEMRVMTNQESSQFNWTSLVRAIEIKNYGMITATNVKMRSKIRIGKKPVKNEILSLTYGTDGMSLLPNSTQSMTFKFTKQYEDAMADPNTETYFMYEISYKSANSKKERKKGMLMQFHPTRHAVLENWGESTKF